MVVDGRTITGSQGALRWPKVVRAILIVVVGYALAALVSPWRCRRRSAAGAWRPVPVSRASGSSPLPSWSCCWLRWTW